MFLILGGFLLMVVFKFGEQIVKWRSWRLPGQGGVVVISPQGFVSSAHFPFRKHRNPFIRPAQGKSPRLPLRKAPPTPSLLSPHPHPNHLHTTAGRQNPTSPQTGKRTQPHPQNHKHPSELRVIHKLRQWSSAQNHKCCRYLWSPPQNPTNKPNIYGVRGRSHAREIHMTISKSASYDPKTSRWK